MCVDTQTVVCGTSPPLITQTGTGNKICTDIDLTSHRYTLDARGGRESVHTGPSSTNLGLRGRGATPCA